MAKVLTFSFLVPHLNCAAAGLERSALCDVTQGTDILLTPLVGAGSSIHVFFSLYMFSHRIRFCRGFFFLASLSVILNSNLLQPVGKQGQRRAQINILFVANLLAVVVFIELFSSVVIPASKFKQLCIGPPRIRLDLLEFLSALPRINTHSLLNCTKKAFI